MKKFKKRRITFNQFFRCFFPGNREKYTYLGYAYEMFAPGTEENKIIKEFIEFVDKTSKPKYIPRFILRLLELFATGNSIVCVRNYTLQRLSSRLLKQTRITDIKTKWDEYDIRIYGYFPQVIYDKIDEVENKFNDLRDEKIGKFER